MKTELKDKDLKREVGHFLILNIGDCSPPNIFRNQEEFISLNGIKHMGQSIQEWTK